MKNVTQTNVQKWGNSLGVRLPKELIEINGLFDGAPVQIFKNKKMIVIKKASVSPENNFKGLIAQITPDNMHGYTDWGKSQGKELW